MKLILLLLCVDFYMQHLSWVATSSCYCILIVKHRKTSPHDEVDRSLKHFSSSIQFRVEGWSTGSVVFSQLIELHLWTDRSAAGLQMFPKVSPWHFFQWVRFLLADKVVEDRSTKYVQVSAMLSCIHTVLIVQLSRWKWFKHIIWSFIQ